MFLTLIKKCDIPDDLPENSNALDTAEEIARQENAIWLKYQKELEAIEKKRIRLQAFENS